jgi:hypothetical protein
MKKLIIFLTILILFPFNNIFAAELLKTVEEDGNGDYTSLEACMDANEQDLTDAGGDYFIAKICGTDLGGGGWDAADTTAVDISGWTTAENNYIRIYTTATARHDGKWDTGAYILNPAAGYRISLSEGWVEFEGLQIQNSSTAVDNNNGINMPNAAVSGNVWISYCIFRGNDDHGWYDIAIVAENNTGNIYIFNNIIYDWGKNNASSGGIRINSNGAAQNTYIENNTLHENYAGLERSDGTVIAINNLVEGSGNTLAYVGTFAAGTDYNATDGTDAIGVGTHNQTSQTFTFTDDTNGDHGLRDFHLASNDAGAKDLGTDTVNSGYTDDIDEVARAGSWDIGADEYAAAGVTIPIFMYYQRQMRRR